MKYLRALSFFFLVSVAFAQNAGFVTPEEHPPLDIAYCDETGCTTQTAAIVIDVDERPTYSVADNSVPCFTYNTGWDPTLCPDPLTCAQNCAVDGLTIDQYETIHGLTTSGSLVRLNYITESAYGTKVGSRSYLVDTNDEYIFFNLNNREFTIDIDNSALECGMDASLYFVEMEKDGGMASYPSNTAGAKYGTGYCDAQCFHYYTYIGGQVNLNGEPDNGLCCVEMDIWEGNSQAQVVTAHGCVTDGYYICERPDECGDNDRYGGVCDKDGGAFNPFRLNVRDYYGEGSEFTLDSSKPLTVVTQFITADGTDTGDLVEIRRLYVQDGVIIENAHVGYEEIGDYDSLTDEYVAAYKPVFGEPNDYAAKGSMKRMGEALARGVVLTFSLWDDSSTHMLWLDSIYPPDADPNSPGAMAGPCPTDGGVPEEMHELYPDAYVTYSNIKFGPIGTTYSLKKD